MNASSRSEAASYAFFIALVCILTFSCVSPPDEVAVYSHYTDHAFFERVKYTSNLAGGVELRWYVGPRVVEDREVAALLRQLLEERSR